MLFISFDGLAYTIPVNPKELTIGQTATNSNIDIIGLGKATRKGEPGLRTLQIKSFFPNPKSKYYFNVPASTYIEFIEKIWNTENINNKVAEISSYGIKDDIAGKELNMPFVIEKFDYKYTGGDFDTEYTLSIKEYKPYGVKQLNTNFSDGMQSARTPSTVKANTPGLMEDTQPTTEAKTYTIKSGDTLWTIAKRCTGDGNNWRALYDLNKEIIGTNPNLIYSGIVLTLPENWNSPTATTNTSTSVKLKSTSSTTNTKIANSTVASGDTTLKNEQGKQTDTSFASDAWMEGNKRVTELWLFEKQMQQHLDDLDRLKANNKVISLSLQTSLRPGLANQVNYKIPNAKKEIQAMYNKAVKISADMNKSEEERAAAIRSMRETEMALYSRTYRETEQYIQK